MANPLVQRTYNLTDPELCMFVSNLVNVIARDIDGLIPFGLTTETISTFKNIGDAFEVFPSDDFMLGDVMIATEAKNAKMEEVKSAIRQMAARVEAKWGVNSGQYKKLGIAGMSDFSDKTLLSASRGVHKSMTVFLSGLAAFGLTQDILDDFEDLNESLELAMNAQGDAIMARDNKTKERIAKGNELYGYVANYCNFGKILFENTDPARYNDYIIYTGFSPGPLVAVTSFGYNQETNDFTWDGQGNATSYQVQASDDNLTFTEIYSGSDIMFHYVPSEDGTKYYKVRARNSGGFGEFSEMLAVEYYISLAAPANLTVSLTGNDPFTVHINWSIVQGATQYNVYHSVVDAAQPAGEFSLLTEINTNSLIAPGAPGKRQYYYIVAANTHLTSPASETRYVDVLPPP